MKFKLSALLITTLLLTSSPIYANVPTVVAQNVKPLQSYSIYDDASKGPTEAFADFDTTDLTNYIHDDNNKQTINNYIKTPSIQNFYTNSLGFYAPLSSNSDKIKTSYNMPSGYPYQIIFFENTGDSNITITEYDDGSAQRNFSIPPHSSSVHLTYDTVPSIHTLEASTDDGSQVQGNFYVGIYTEETLPFEAQLKATLHSVKPIQNTTADAEVATPYTQQSTSFDGELVIDNETLTSTIYWIQPENSSSYRISVTNNSDAPIDVYYGPDNLKLNVPANQTNTFEVNNAKAGVHYVNVNSSDVKIDGTISVRVSQ